jgi:hypothetical protein
MSYCTSCGAQNPDEPAVCAYCGLPLAETEANTRSQPLPPAEDYRKIGGLLLLFMTVSIVAIVVTIVVAVSVNGFFALIHLIAGSRSWGGENYVGSSSFLSLLIVGAIGLGAVALQLSSIIQLIKRKPSFLTLYQLYKLLGIGLLLYLSIDAGLIRKTAANISGFVPILVFSIVELIWLTLYFCKSERVRTFMGGHEYMKKALFAIKAD